MTATASVKCDVKSKIRFRQTMRIDFKNNPLQPDFISIQFERMTEALRLS